MKRRAVTDVAASTRRRLYNLALAEGVEYNSILVRFALERLLFRLGASTRAADFVIKGAMLFAAWTESPHRSTRDLDLLGLGAITADNLRASFRLICDTAVPEDGLRFDAGTIRIEDIREQQEYVGFRLTMSVYLGTARIPLQVDIGVGDPVVPGPEMITYPTLLDLPPPHLQAYTRESLVAEKTHAIVTLGIGNSRMKDFYDIMVLSLLFPFSGNTLLRAIRATFERRGTAMPESVPTGLTDAFGLDGVKRAQWDGFRRRLAEAGNKAELSEVIIRLREFLWPVLQAASRPEGFEREWDPAEGWQTANRN